MIPKILHFTVPEKIHPEQQRTIDSARALHPDWRVAVWADRDAGKIEGARLLSYFDRANSGAQRADLLRLDILYGYGGVYLDLDFKLYKSLDPLVDNFDFFICSEDGQRLCTAAIGCAPRHAAVDAVIGFLQQNEPDWSLPPNETTGPELASKVLRWRNDLVVLPRETFYPYNWNEKASGPHRLSYAEHLWAGSWKPKSANARAHHNISKSIKVAAKKALKASIRTTGKRLERFYGTYRKGRTGGLVTSDFLSYGRAPEIVVRTIHGHKLIVDGYDLSVTPDLATVGTFEWSEEAFVRRHLRGGDWFIDVGANVGVFSILAAGLCGPHGRVLAFEPNPRARDLLRKSAAMNWYHDRIKTFDFALGDAKGSTTLTFYPDRLGDAQTRAIEKEGAPFSATGRFLGDPTEISINVEMLDEHIPVDVTIKIMKIDAEGDENKILRGSKRLLSHRAFDYIMLEAEAELSLTHWHETIGGLQELCDYGYRPATIDQHGNLKKSASLSEAIRSRQGKTLVFYAG